MKQEHRRKQQKVEEQFNLLRKTSRDFEESSAVALQQQALLAYLNGDMDKCVRFVYDFHALVADPARHQLKAQYENLRTALFEEIARCGQLVAELVAKRDGMARPPSMKIFTSYRKFKSEERWVKAELKVADDLFFATTSKLKLMDYYLDGDPELTSVLSSLTQQQEQQDQASDGQT